MDWTWVFHKAEPWHQPFFAHPTQHSTMDYDTLSEFISDTDRWDRRRIDDNDCDHYKSVTTRNSNNFSFALKAESGYPGSYFTVTMNDPAWAYTAYNTVFGIDGLQGLPFWSSGESLSVQEYIDNSIKTMLPGIKPKLSILNSIFELKDFKTLPKLLRSTTQAARNFYNSGLFLRHWKSAYTKRTLKQLQKLAASHYLNYSFNVRSLVSDVMQVYNAYQSVGKQIKSLLDNEGKVRVRHYACSYPLFEDSDETQRITGTSYPYAYDGVDLRRVVSTIDPPMFRAAMVYQYVLSDSQRSNANLYGSLDALGINLNPSIIWNAIPWSFVVDWVVGVSQFLDQFKEGNLTPTTNILRYCWSVKATRKVTNYVNMSVGSPEPSGNVVAICTDQYFYFRRKHQPDWIRWFSTSGLNLKEFSYIGALIGSRH